MAKHLMAAAALLTIAGTNYATAQDYPARPVTIIVPLQPADRPISRAGSSPISLAVISIRNLWWRMSAVLAAPLARFVRPVRRPTATLFFPGTLAMVPFTGTAPVLTAMLAGEIDYECDPVLGTLSQVRAGAVKALAVAARKRSPMLPDVPTSHEQGLPEFDCAPFYGVFVPSGTSISY